ncbi:MAG: ABC transporter substrate-binding protein [Thermodesulfobacteriota bacterium]
MKTGFVAELRSVALILALMVAWVAGPVSAGAEEGKKIVYNGSGGFLEKVIKKVFTDPFEKETGIKVVMTAPVNFAKLKAMCESGNLEWDLTELRAEHVVRGKELGYLAEIDYQVIDKSDFLEGLAHSHAVPAAFYSTVLAYNTKKFPAGKEPKSWADFWDVKNFPGPRSLPNFPWTLELALLADGVPADKLYPLDEKRAWKSLDKIKPHISVWWTMPAKPAQLLTDGEVDLTASFNGRITEIQREGAPVAIQWNQQILLLSYNAVVKGSKNRDAVMKFLAFILKPEAQAEFVKMIPYPGPSKSMFKYLPPELTKHLPTNPEYYRMAVHRDYAFWVKNEERLLEEWNAWMLK